MKVLRTGILLCAFCRSASACWQCEANAIYLGEQVGSDYAAAVAGAGDVDGDGHDDLIVGQPGFDGKAGESCGRAIVYSGLTAEILLCWEGETPWSLFGAAVDGAGDVDGDGRSDLVIGAPIYDGLFSQIGRIYVYSGATGNLLWLQDGEGLEDQFGWSVANAGDVDNDGTPDLVVGARAPGPNIHQPGKAYVYSGNDGQLIWSWNGQTVNDRFGTSVAGAGDVDGDGFSDVVIGAPVADTDIGNNSGRVYVLSGATGEVVWTQDGEHSGSNFGYSVSGPAPASASRSGVPIVIVGARDFFQHPFGLFAGKTYVFCAVDGTLLWSRVGENANDLLGGSVSGAGDFNGDGVEDVVVGAQFGDGVAGIDVGKVYVRSGLNGELLRSWSGESFFDLFGFAVTGAGDRNNDGYSDVAIGAIFVDGLNGNSTGKAYLYLGGPDGDLTCDAHVGIEDLIVLLRSWGLSLECAADLNGDGRVGIVDLLILLANWG